MVARYAAECAQEVLSVFEERHPGDRRPRVAAEAARAAELIAGGDHRVGAQRIEQARQRATPGFVAVQDAHTLLLPERRGNNRIDSLRNIVLGPRVALLFLIPGVGETLRVNGRASITTAPDLLERFVVDGKPPKCVVVVAVDSAFFQCARARSSARNYGSRPQRTCGARCPRRARCSPPSRKEPSTATSTTAHYRPASAQRCTNTARPIREPVSLANA